MLDKTLVRESHVEKYCFTQFFFKKPDVFLSWGEYFTYLQKMVTLSFHQLNILPIKTFKFLFGRDFLFKIDKTK